MDETFHQNNSDASRDSNPGPSQFGPAPYQLGWKGENVLIQNPSPRMSKGADPKLGSESITTRRHCRGMDRFGSLVVLFTGAARSGPRSEILLISRTPRVAILAIPRLVLARGQSTVVREIMRSRRCYTTIWFELIGFHSEPGAFLPHDGPPRAAHPRRHRCPRHATYL